MTNLIDYIWEAYGSLFSLISLPITLLIYLRENENKRYKALEEISDKVIELIVNNEDIEKDDIERIKTYVLAKGKIESKKFKNEVILNHIISKIEESPFVLRNQKLIYKERVKKIDCQFFRITDSPSSFNAPIFNKILGYSILISSISYILSKEQIDIISQVSFIGYLLLGILIIILTYVLYMIIIFYLGRNHLQGEFRVSNQSLKSLQLSKYSALVMNTSNDRKDYVFSVGEVKSDVVRRIVDTYPGPFGSEFLMTKTLQDHEKFRLNLFCKSLNLKIEYLLQKESEVNGSERFDVLYISLIKNNDVLVQFTKCIKSDIPQLEGNGKKYFDNYIEEFRKQDALRSSYSKIMKVVKGNYLIAVDEDYLIAEINVEGKRYLLKEMTKTVSPSQ